MHKICRVAARFTPFLMRVKPFHGMPTISLLMRDFNIFMRVIFADICVRALTPEPSDHIDAS